MIKLFIAAAGLALAIAAPDANALIITEAPGDAGSTLATADRVAGNTAITQIRGNKGADNGVDMFELFISDTTAFRARTSNNTQFDTQLFLFDSNGFGVIANDDRASSTGSRLGGFSGPAGLYYLAISGYDADPLSALGEIFPDTPFNAIVGPTGPGGAEVLSGWNREGFYSGRYRINIRGAFTSVPEPASLAILGSALVGFASLRRRKA